jgi:hypothetical protein
MKSLTPRLAVGCLTLLACGLPANAAFFSGSGNGQSNNPIAASANFTYNAGTGVLSVVLTNTSTFNYAASPNSARAVPSDVLTGLFFDYNGGFGPSLTFNTATTPTITVGSNPANLKLSSTPGGWDYAQGASLPGVTQSYGLGTAGFDIFDGGTSSGGTGSPTNFGVMNSLYVDGEGNPSVNGTPYAKNSITFSLTVGSGVASAFDVSKIGNVRFQYGTALGEGSFQGNEVQAVPAPAGLVLALVGAPMLLVQRLRRRAA